MYENEAAGKAQNLLSNNSYQNLMVPEHQLSLLLCWDYTFRLTGI